MNFDDFFTAFYIRDSDDNLSVESARSQKCRVEDVRPVGSRKDDDSGVLRKSVHFNEKLVERLFSFVMSAADSCASLAAYGIDFVYENNARSVFLRLFKKVPHSGCTHADKHFNEVRTADCKERHARFAGCGLGNVGFSCSRRPHKQNSLRNSGSELSVFSWVFQEVHNLRKFLFFFFKSGNIFECNLLVAAFDHLGPGLCELERLAVSALVHHDVEKEHECSDHNDVRYQRPKP